MNKPVLLLPLLALLLGSCTESFTPKVDFVPKPVVTCLVAGSETGFTVAATVAQTYDVPFLDPLENRTDPFDTSAVVALTLNGDAYPLKLTRSKRIDTMRYSTPVYRFTSSGPLPNFSTGKFSLSVTTAGGERLSGSSTMPRHRTIETSYNFVAGVTAQTTDPLWKFSWDEGQRDDRLYFPKMVLSYQVINGTSTVNKSVEIPLRVIDQGGKNVAVYPSFTRNLSLEYDFAALEWALVSISDGDPEKGRYTIGMLTFTLVEYDVHLSNYYASSHGYLDEYSIRVDETVYSNVSGGIGIVGAYFTNRLPFEMKVQYIRSFGYRI